MNKNFMRVEDAIEIVLELARQKMLDKGILTSPEILEERKRRAVAIDTIEDFFVNNVFQDTDSVGGTD